MGATQVLAEYVNRTSFSALPKDVVRKAKGIVLDTLGCGIAGYTLASHEFHWILDLVKEMGGKPSIHNLPRRDENFRPPGGPGERGFDSHR